MGCMDSSVLLELINLVVFREVLVAVVNHREFTSVLTMVVMLLDFAFVLEIFRRGLDFIDFLQRGKITPSKTTMSIILIVFQHDFLFLVHFCVINIIQIIEMI
jgi:hypothetical protein